MGQVAMGPGPTSEPIAAEATRTIPLVSPLGGGGVLGTIDVRFGPPRPRVATDPSLGPAVTAVTVVGLPEADDEAPLPEEAVSRLAEEAQSATLPVEAPVGRVLHVRFAPAAQDQIVSAFQALREIIHERPGDTPVVLHIPAGPGRSQRMELRVRVAYDAELIAGISRRVGDSMVELSLR